MSRSGTLTFNVKTNIPTRIKYFIDSFNRYGWTMNVDGNIKYLPIGDNNDYNWEYADSSNMESVISHLTQKQDLNEQLGFYLINKLADVALEVLVNPQIDNLLFTAHGDRKLIEGLGITDFTWYIKQIIPVLSSMDMELEQIECSDW